MADIILNVELRERIGTGGARAARREGLVPGVLYGGDKDPVAITVKSNEFRKALYTGKLLGHLVTLKHGNESQPARTAAASAAKNRTIHNLTTQRQPPTHNISRQNQLSAVL